MTAADTLTAALECEHCEIDEGIGPFLASRVDGQGHIAPLRRPIDASSETLLRQLERHAKEESIG